MTSVAGQRRVEDELMNRRFDTVLVLPDYTRNAPFEYEPHFFLFSWGFFCCINSQLYDLYNIISV